MKMLDLAEVLGEDTWQSASLKVSGSNEVVVDNALILKHRMLDARLIKDCGTPGSEAAGWLSLRTTSFCNSALQPYWPRYGGCARGFGSYDR